MRAVEYQRRRRGVWRRVGLRVQTLFARQGVPVTDEQREQFAQTLVHPVRRARDESAQLAAHFYNGEAVKHGAARVGKPTPEFYPREAIESVLERAQESRVTIEGLDKLGAETARPTVRIEGLDDVGVELEQARVLVDESNRRDPAVVAQVADRVERAMLRHVEQAGRDTILEAIAAEESRIGRETPVGWARMLTGAESCGFCAMLASRGPVYTSRESALQVVGQRRSARQIFNQRPARTRGTRSLGEKFHDGCDCLIVPVFDEGDWIGIDQFDALEDLWINSDGRKDFRNRFNRIRKDPDELAKYIITADAA